MTEAQQLIWIPAEDLLGGFSVVCISARPGGDWNKVVGCSEPGAARLVVQASQVTVACLHVVRVSGPDVPFAVEVTPDTGT